jgi:hypothetical protein
MNVPLAGDAPRLTYRSPEWIVLKASNTHFFAPIFPKKEALSGENEVAVL